MAAHDPPPDRLGAEPEIQSPEDVERALRELGWLQAREAELAGAAQRKIDALRQEAQAKLVVPQGRGEVTFADRRSALESAVRDFVRDNAASLFPGKTKTREFAAGSVSLRQQPQRVAYAEGFTAERVLERIGERGKAKVFGGLLAKIVAVLKAIKLWPGLTADVFVEAKAEIARARILDHHKKGLVSDEQLKLLGLAVTRAEDEVRITLSDHVASESREPVGAAE